MSLRPYPSYKDSGIEWLGEVPSHWIVAPLKRGFSVALGKMLQPERKAANDILMPYIRAANIQWSGVDMTDVKQMWFSAAEIESLRLLPGDLLVSEGGDVGRSCLWAGELDDCYFQNSVNRVRPLGRNTNAFLRYWISALKDKGFIDVLCNKSTIAHFTAEKVQTVPVPLPPTEEQPAIAAFLDRETGKIDALVAEQEKLIELLKEKRQAVISHAVTKGLDPAAPMKDSGIKWLGKVPAHWSAMRLKYVVPRIEQGWSPETIDRLSEENEWGVLKAGCVNYGRFRETEHKTLPPTIVPPSELQVLAGDVLMSRASGSVDLIGSVACVESCSYRLIMSDKIFRLQVDQATCLKTFLVKAMGANPLRTQIVQAVSGAEGLANNIGKAAIREFWVAVPPLKEQEEINAFLDAEIAKLENLVAEAQRAIGLLKEHRSALISAAVTGKIDVRGLVETNPPARALEPA